jgi:hypothetical protein
MITIDAIIPVSCILLLRSLCLLIQAQAQSFTPRIVPARRDIMPLMLPELHLEDRVRLRKPHPCGSYEWKIVRLGADIGLECLECGRRVMLPRRTLARRLKTLYPNSTDEQTIP